MTLKGGQAIKLMKTKNIQIVQDGGNTPHYVAIKAIDNNGAVVWPEITRPNFGLSSRTFLGTDIVWYPPSTNDPTLVAVVPMYAYADGALIFNSNTLIFPPNVTSFDILFFSTFSQNSSEVTLDDSIHVDLIEPADIIDYNTKGDNIGCSTFERLTLSPTDYQISQQLTGFCGVIRHTVSLPHSSIPESNEFEDHPTLGSNIAQFAEDCHELCDHMGVPQNSPQTPCGCKQLKLKTILYPCEEGGVEGDYYSECEPLVIENDIEVCCTCDITKWRTKSPF